MDKTTNANSVTVGDVIRGVGSIVKKGVESAREGAAELQKADLSPKAIKEKVETTTLTQLAKYAGVIFLVYCAWELFGKPLWRAITR